VLEQSIKEVIAVIPAYQHKPVDGRLVEIDGKDTEFVPTGQLVVVSPRSTVAQRKAAHAVYIAKCLSKM
jgi:hypothetical protein